MQNIWSIMLFNAFLGPILAYFDVLYIIKLIHRKWVIKKGFNYEKC